MSKGKHAVAHMDHPTNHLYDNGFKVIYEPAAANGLPITYIRVFCNLGSINESGAYHGASHFIEHMCFKGTTAMPASEQIALAYDKQGAFFNAHTEKRYTCYVVKCNDAHFPESIRILADMMTKSLFDKHEYAKEKHVVMEETIQLNDQPDTQLFTMIDRMIYRGSSYANPIDIVEYHTGDESNILNYDNIVEMYRKFYRPNQMVMSVVSHIPMPEIMANISKTAFVRGVRTHAAIAKNACKTPPVSLMPNYSLAPQSEIQCSVFRKKGVYATYFGVGFRTCAQTNPDKYVLDLLKYILGGYMSSRLFQLLRNKHGLTYSSKVYTEYFEHTGKFFIYVSVDPRKIIRNCRGKRGRISRGRSNHKKNNNTLCRKGQKGVIPIVVDMIRDLIRNGISAKELETAKGFIQGNQIIRSENGDNACFQNGVEYLLYDNPEKIVSYKDMYEAYYRSITREDLHSAIRRYFCKSNTNIVCVGENAPDESVILRECVKIYE